MHRVRPSDFLIDTSDITLVRAQVAAFSKQVPLLYTVLSINAALCMISFAAEVPAWLGLYLPLFIIAICSIRTIVWLFKGQVALTDDQVRRRLKGVVWIGGVITTLMVVWFVGLFMTAPTAVTRVHTAFALTVTAFSCMICLLHMRTAMLMVASSVVPLSIAMFISGDLRLATVGVNLILALSAIIYILAVASKDFDRMIQLSSERARLANLDNLTELPNRRAFFERLNVVLTRAQRTRRPFAVGVLDVDGFKAVNDLYGHITGDRLLIEAGRRLQAAGGKDIYLCRLGGDEFALIVQDARDPAALLALGDRLCATVAQPFSLPGALANVSASIGLAVYPVAGEDAEHLYERADYALYFAKSGRRGQSVIFSEAHEHEIRQRSTVEQALRTADLDAELCLHFQPLIDVDQGRPVAFEALARWNNPELGNVPPNIFIPIAERTDLIHTITHTLLRKALAAIRTLPEDVHISFNLSMRDIASAEAMLAIETLVRESGIAAARIEFEITESSLMADFAQALSSVHMLRRLGSRVALDDFGTGYSSLSHVHRLPLDKIKIDRSFIVDLESRDTSRDILKTVIDLCENLDIICVVEGTETQGQTEIVRRLGCRSMQGYFFARPMPLEEVPAFLEHFSMAALERHESRSRESGKPREAVDPARALLEA